MSDDSDSEVRGRGFLTLDDRQYLLGKKEDQLKDSARRQKHLNIRNRLENAIHDFQVVERHLPDRDIQQVFEPAYEWGRERRRLNDQGLYNTNPETTEFIQSLVALFNFYGYSMTLSQIEEVYDLRNSIVNEGFERGLRKFSLNRGGDYIDYDAHIEIVAAHREARQNHLVQVDRSIPEKPDEAANEILNLYHQYKIPGDFARQLWKHYVGQKTI